MTTNALALDNQLCFAIYSASHAFTKVYKPLLAELDVTYPQYLVLLFLWEKQEARVTDICVALGLDTGTLSPLLKRLEKTGYIKRERSVADERQVVVQLTPLGQSRRKVAEGILQEIGKAIGCSFEEASVLLGSIKDLKQRLSAA
ncbi:MarR family transcriptional regulator [Rhizobium sp. TH2]|uniref:MarR family winged helix-turn-helix transcriptional regulator n=1 Tax=Rhizobium sp. TH2 TaxID=2775403 RepID=UPI0021582F9A|nr:MarR family transcriptional regulator [Rhizobium sp. TH2]UVC06763.1 MarR family transcriptional regulator [Rhizobium sp. TH2]